MVRVCCFCDKIHDDAIGLWQEQRGDASSCAMGESLILSYTCCHQCFNVDPRASVFRDTRNEPNGSRDSAAVRPLRLRWSGAAA